MNEYGNLTQAVIDGKREEVEKLVREALDSGKEPQDIVENGMVPGMSIIGERFKNNEIFVPEMLIAARAMKQGMALLEPLLVKAGIKPKYTAIIGTVEGDLHDIGKNLVAMMWKGANINVVDLGTNISPEKFVEGVKEHNPQIVGLSALLTTTMPAMEKIVQAIRQSDNGKVKIVIGGAPVTRQYAEEIGADGFAEDAGSAVDVAMDLLSA